MFSLAYPVVLSNLSASAMHVVDSAMVGRLGPTELAAVGYGGIWTWTALTLFMGTATGVQTFVAQADGSGDQASCGSWAWQGFYAVAPITLMGIVAFVAVFPDLIAALGPSAELQHFATLYVSWRALGCVGLGLLMVLSSFFRGIGDTRTPLIAALISTLVNVVLDYGLIFGELGLPEWGVEGAGAATAVAEWVGAGVLLVALCRARLRRFGVGPVRPDPKQIRRFLRTSLPIGGQWFIEMTSFAMFSTVVARMGDASMAASQALIALLSLSFMQAVGIGIASATLVGRYVGAGDLIAAERSHRTSIRLGLALGAVIGFLLLVFPEWLIAIFSDDPEVVRLGKPLVRLGGLFQVFDALQLVANGSLRGAGDTRWPFAVQSTLAWLALPVVWFVGVWLDAGVVGAWWAMSGYVVVLAFVLLRRFQRGAWKQVKI